MSKAVNSAQWTVNSGHVEVAQALLPVHFAQALGHRQECPCHQPKSASWRSSAAKPPGDVGAPLVGALPSALPMPEGGHKTRPYKVAEGVAGDSPGIARAGERR